jgi:hypothetical protein
MRAPSLLFVMSGSSVTSLAVVLLIIICFVPSVWLKIGV